MLFDLVVAARVFGRGGISWIRNVSWLPRFRRRNVLRIGHSGAIGFDVHLVVGRTNWLEVSFFA